MEELFAKYPWRSKAKLLPIALKQGFKEKDELFIICEKDGKSKRLKEEKTDCPDWVIDTR